MNRALVVAVVLCLAMAAPTARAEAILVVDFEDGSFGPFVDRDSGWTVEDGAARCHIAGAYSYSLAATAPDVLPESFQLQVRLRSDIGANHILNFLLQENGDHYHLNYRTAPFNDVHLYHVVDGVNTELAAADVASAQNQQWFDLGVMAGTSRLEVTLDGAVILEHGSWQPAYGEGGLAMACFVGGSAAEAQVAYDEVRVFSGEVAGLEVSPRHGRVVLDWVNPLRPDIEGTEVYRALVTGAGGTSAYPLYERDPEVAIPVNPGSRQEAQDSPAWELVVALPPHVTHYEDPLPERGRYHYVLFNELTGEEYTPAMVLEHAATSYLLGDVVNDDGAVDWADLGQYLYRFGADDGEARFDPGYDVAPTAGGSITGVPHPDGRIDFEDLMIAAAGFGAVYAHEPPPDLAPPLVADVRLTQFGATEVLCEVIDPGPGFIGLHLTGPVALAPVEFLEGPLLDELDGIAYFAADDERPCDLSLALIGEDVLVDRPGTLFYLQFEQPIEIGSVSVEVRGPANLPVQNDGYATGVDTAPPLLTGVHVQPNPFNPITTISYDLRRSGQVAVEIFDARGALVRELARGEYPASRLRWRWDGVDGRGSAVASGVYFCRIETAGETAVGKLLLAR